MIYIYIYIYRERERKRNIGCVDTKCAPAVARYAKEFVSAVSAKIHGMNRNIKEKSNNIIKAGEKGMNVTWFNEDPSVWMCR